MRRALILAVAGVFITSGAMACPFHQKSAEKTTDNQTVMTDQGQGGQTPIPQSGKSDTNG